MPHQEIVLAKQCALTTNDWDTYQAIIRTCLSPRQSGPVSTPPPTGRQKLHGQLVVSPVTSEAVSQDPR